MDRYEIPTADDLDGYHRHQDSYEVVLCIDPDARRVYAHARIGGNELPARAHKGLQPCLVLPRRVLGEAAHELLTGGDAQALIARIGAGVVETDRYGGDVWGRLTDAASDALGALDLLCEALTTYCDAGDWCAEGWATCRDEVRDCNEDDDKLDALAEAWVADARSNGVYLHLVDVARIIQQMLNEIAEEGEDNA